MFVSTVILFFFLSRITSFYYCLYTTHVHCRLLHSAGIDWHKREASTWFRRPGTALHDHDKFRGCPIINTPKVLAPVVLNEVNVYRLPAIMSQQIIKKKTKIILSTPKYALRCPTGKRPKLRRPYAIHRNVAQLALAGFAQPDAPQKGRAFVAKIARSANLACLASPVGLRL